MPSIPLTPCFTKSYPISFGALLTVGISLGFQGSLVAQTTAEPAPATPERTEEVITLSPFEVNAHEDLGYQAGNTLAGTRLRSSLSDIAAPISVYTPEFLKDIGASNFQEAMLYSVNVENENEFAPDDSEGESISSTTQTRVRGLSSATQTRGFFKTNFRADMYNVDRLTVASGPNSILFGIGSPAGVLDATPIQATLQKQHFEVGTRFDNFGSRRASVDINVPVLKDVFGIRYAGLTQKDKTFRKPEFDDERRHFITATFKPFADTQVRASYESLKDNRVRARESLMEDSISDWIALGKPLYDHSTGKWTFDGGSTWQTRPDLQYWTDTSRIGSDDRVFMAGGAKGDSTVQGLIWRNTGISFNRNRDYAKSLADRSLVDFDVNYYGLGDRTRLTGENKTIVVEQKVAKGLYLEAAFNKENNIRDQDDPLRAGLSSIQADVNYYLPYTLNKATGLPDTTGSLVKNPNAGRYFIESEYLGYTQLTDYKTERVMASYAHNFADQKLGWLGKYNFGAMWQRETTDNFKIKRRLMNEGADWIVRANDPVNPSLNNIKSRYYLNLPGLGGDSSGVDYPGEFQLPPWQTIVGGIQDDGKPSKSETVVTGKLFVTQASLLKDSLILTYGYRNDSQKVRTANFTQRDSVTHEWITKGVGLGDAIVQSGATQTYGAVYHTPVKGLSLTYNRSDAFNPQGGFRDWFNNPLPPGTGVGEDYGVTVELAQGKFYAKLSRFTNTSKDAVEYDWYYEEPKWSVIANMDAGWGMVTNYAARLGNTADINAVDSKPGFSWDAVRATRDYSSKGYELELFYKPTSQMDLRLTLAQSEAVNTRIVPYLQEYIKSRLAVWEKYYGYPAWHQWDTDMPAWDPNWATNPDSTGYQLLTFGLPRIEEYKAAEGTSTTRGRKWRGNLVANYKFEGRLKGVSVGGALRWRSADTIGYYGKPNPLLPSGKKVPDITKPIHGDEIFDLDAWVAYGREFNLGGKKIDWSVQLNARNLVNGGKLVPLAAYTDGTITSYEKSEPITLLLTNTFGF